MDLGWTIKEAAKRLRVTETTVGNWERRNIKPDRKTMEKLKDLLGLEEEFPI